MKLALDFDGMGALTVLLHGFPFDRTLWRGQVAALETGLMVVCPDLRGHGETATPGGVHDVDAMADDVLETLDGWAMTGPMVLGGLSMGGYVALSIAARFPERVRALMLMNTRAAADSPEAAENRLRLARSIEEKGSIEDFVEGMLPKLFASGNDKARPDVVAALREQMLRTSPESVAATLRGLASRPDRTADLPNIKVPTLVIAGEEDQVVPIAEARAMAAAIPGAELVTIPGTGHLSPIEDSEATNRAIVAFLIAHAS